MGHARALLSLDSPAEQLRLREEILTHSWSVRTTEQGVQAKRTQPTRRLLRRSAELAAVEDALRVALATAGAHRRQRARRAHRGQLLLSRRAGSADRADLDDVALESSA